MVERAVQRRRLRFRLVTALIYLGLGVVLFAIRFELERYFGLRPEILLAAAGAGAAFGTGLLLLMYLRGDIRIPFIESLEPSQPSSGQDLQRIENTFASFHRQLGTLERKLNELEEFALSGAVDRVGITEEERTKLLSALKEDLPKTLAEDLRLTFESEIAESAFRATIGDIFDATVYRLKAEISALARRGNLNLVIGVLTTTIAVGLLAYMVLGVTETLESVPEMVQYYVPRVSTAAFIEVFSFFFLRLYRSSLEQIRYYQDELTRITERRVALLAVEAAGDADLLGTVAVRLSADRQLPSGRDTGLETSAGLDGLSNLLDAIAGAVRKGVGAK